MTDVRSVVASACQVLARAGQGDLIWGHAAARDPDGRGAWLKAAGYGLDEIDATRVHLVDRYGEVLEGDGRRHIEYPIHTEILAARPDVGGVVHTHAPSVIAFAATGHPLRPISHDASLFVPPGLARFEETGDLIVTPELGGAVAASLGTRNAVALVHHGLVTVGPDVALATIYAILLERACDSQLRAESAGGVVSWSSDAEALSKRARHGAEANLRAAFAYLERGRRAESTANGPWTS